MKKKLLIFSFMLTITCSVAFGQGRVVTGKVTDALDGQAMIGVNVVIEGTLTGTVTDIDGNFQLAASANDVLVFSFIGYERKTVAVGNQTVINVQIKPDLRLLDDVVVVGYGTIRRSDLTGSVTSVGEDDLRSSLATSLDMTLQGKAAGVEVTQLSGQPGGGVSVRIRGANSLSGTNEPLYVIDGIPVSGDSRGTATGFDWAGGGNGQTAVNGLSAINPNDIVSVEILKDASATAIYGSRAANGVVLITTRQGQDGATRVEYNGYLGIQEMPKRIDMLNLSDYARFHNELSKENNLNPNPLFADPDILGEGTNWQDEVFTRAIMHNHDISVSGGNPTNQYALSFGYMNQDGIVIGSGFNRLSTRLSAQTKPKNWITIGGNMSMGLTNERITLNDDDRGVVTLSLIQRPDIPVKLPDGSWGGPLEGQPSLTNPVAMAMLRDMTLKRMRFMSNVYANITLAEGLVFRTQYGNDVTMRNNYAFNPTYELGTIVNTVNQSRRTFSNSQFWIFSNFLTYEKTIGDKLLSSTMVGTEAQESQWEGLMGGRTGFISNEIQELNAGDASTAINSQYKGSNALLSYFGRLNLTLLDRYLFTGTYRADASSNFGPNNKWGFFPSMAFAWKISEENFMHDISQLSSLKLRIGYGQVGNQDIGGYTYGSALNNYPTRWGVGLLPNRYANPDVKWETTTSYNVGLDLAMFSNRVEFIADVYLKQTNDLLMPLTLPLYMGTSAIQAPMVNVGSIENKGFELTLNTVNSTGSVGWNSGLTFTLNRNMVTDLYDEGNVIDRNVQWFNHATRSMVGKPLGQFYGYVADGIFKDAEDIRNHASQGSIGKANGVWPGDVKFKDLNDDGVINEDDKTFIGNPQPKFTMGFNNTLTYKNFEMRVYMLGSYGNEILNYTRTMTESMGNFTNQSIAVKDRAMLGLKDESLPNTEVDNVFVINPGTTVPRSSHTNPNSNNRISTLFIEDGSFLKIKNVSLNYNLPHSMLSQTNLSSLRVYVNIQNLYTFTIYKGFDPEVGPFNQDPLLNGIDNGNYPAARVYTFGINIGF